MSLAQLIPDRCECGSRAHVVSLVNPRARLFRVVCERRDCPKEGPARGTERGAITDWNRMVSGVMV